MERLILLVLMFNLNFVFCKIEERELDLDSGEASNLQGVLKIVSNENPMTQNDCTLTYSMA